MAIVSERLNAGASPSDVLVDLEGLLTEVDLEPDELQRLREALHRLVSTTEAYDLTSAAIRDAEADPPELVNWSNEDLERLAVAARNGLTPGGRELVPAYLASWPDQQAAQRFTAEVAPLVRARFLRWAPAVVAELERRRLGGGPDDPVSVLKAMVEVTP